MMQSAPIRNPPCVKCKLASGVRTWNCAGPGTSKLATEAPEGCVPRRVSRKFRICQRKRGFRGG
eukprot:6906925-Alexandrium_andersonii.AAC.1